MARGIEGTGRVLAGNPGIWRAREPDTVRVPVVAVEVRSPTDRTGALLQNVGQWLEAGVTAVWVIDPTRRIAQCCERDGTVMLLGDDDVPR